MAIGKAVELAETSAPRKRYIGYTNVNVVGINPNKQEWEKLYGLQREDEIVYLSRNTVNGVDTEQLRIDMIIKTDPDKSGGVEITDRISYFIANAPNYNKAGDKVQMVDAYGDFCWLPVEQAKAGNISGANARFSGEKMRPAYVGEQALVDCIRAYSGIPERTYWNNDSRTWKEIATPNDALMQLDYIETYFNKGDIAEIKAIPIMNQIRVLFGIKKTDDGKLYSDIYSKTVLKSNQRDASWVRVEKEIMEAKERGSYPNTTFEIVPLKEYVPDMSKIEQPAWSEPKPAFGGGVSKFFTKG